MKFHRIALITAVVLVAAVVAATLVWWVSDDTAAREAGSCDGATYALEAEREGKTLELSFEVQSSAPGETWQVRIEGADGPLVEGERQTDEDAEIDVDAFAPNAAGGEFTATATQGDQTCTATITAS